MKTLIITTILILLPVLSYAWEWDRMDTAREVVSAGLTVIDWGQTRDIRNHQGMIELNAILGRTPSNSAIGTYFMSVLVIHPIISALLPKEADILGFHILPRTAWQYFYMGVEGAAISSNYHSGLRMSF